MRIVTVAAAPGGDAGFEGARREAIAGLLLLPMIFRRVARRQLRVNYSRKCS